MKKTALFTCGFFLILLFITGIAGPAGAAEMREMPPRTEVPVNLRLVDEENKPLTGEKTVTIEVTKGGLKDPAVLTSGLRIKDGIGHFVYITPATPGLAEIRIIDPETGKVLEAIVFYIIEPEPPTRKDESVLVTQVIGKAEIQPGARLLRSGEKLVAGVTVTAAADSWLNLELFDGSQIIVQPGTVLRLVSVKRGITTTGKEVRLNLVSGQLFVASQVFTEGSSLFQIRTPGAELYAYGRAFEVAVSSKGTEAITYQGELLMEDGESGLLFPVVQGQKALLPTGGGIPSYSSHRLTAEMREDILRGEGFLGKKSTAMQTFSGSAYQMGGSMTVRGLEGVSQTTMSLKPQFYNVFGSDYSFGLVLPFSFAQTTGRVKFGESINGRQGTGPLLDWLRFENEVCSLNYDFIEEGLTYGYGLLLGDYTSKFTRRTHFGLNIGEGLRVEVLAPWNIRSINPWDFDSASLYAGRIEETFNSDRLNLQLGLTYVVDNSIIKDLRSLLPGFASQGLAIDAGFFVTEAFQPYMEAAALKSSRYGWGMESGVLGKAGAFRYRIAGRYLGKGFHPNYFGGDYDMNTLSTLWALAFLGDPSFPGRPLALLDDPVYTPETGYYVGFGVTAGEILSLDLSFENGNRKDIYFPILTGKLELNLLRLGPVPAVSAGFDYRCYQFSKFSALPDANTICANYVEVMLARGVYAAYKNTYIPLTDSHLRELSLEVRWEK